MIRNNYNIVHKNKFAMLIIINNYFEGQSVLVVVFLFVWFCACTKKYYLRMQAIALAKNLVNRSLIKCMNFTNLLQDLIMCR